MPATQDYEYLLECANVIGVDYDEQADRVTVFVSRKVPAGDLEPEDDVEKRVQAADDDVEVNVVDSGYGEEREGFDALSVLEPVPEAAEGRQERHRPVVAGVSEINAESTAATAGPYPARLDVADLDGATWSEDVEPGDLVRLSNNHVYNLGGEADLGDPIVQPSPRDGGSLPDDEVGELVGYVPIEDGVVVDVSARSVDPERESADVFELDPSWPTGIRREDYADLRGQTLIKSGRTTGVTSADLEATSASVRVEFGGDHGTVLFRDQLVAGYMSEGGDSGSPVFLENGALVGLLFAGSAEQTIVNKIGNVESELGVRLLTDEPDGDGEGDESGGDGGDEDEDGTDHDDGVPVFTTTVETTLELDLNAESDDPAAALSLVSVTLEDQPAPGRSVPATIAVSATARGEYWLEVNGDRVTFSLGDADEVELEGESEAGSEDENVDGSEDKSEYDDGAYRRDVSTTLTIPSDATETLEVRVRGGTVSRSA